MQNSDGKSALGLDPNVAAGLCYIPVCGINLIMSIIVLVTEKTNKLARFHAFQSLLLLAAAVVGYIVCWVITVVIVMAGAAMNMPGLGFLGFLVIGAYALIVLAAVIMACIKAFTGQVYKLPIIGNLADNWSN